jgi:hypothetical protein
VASAVNYAQITGNTTGNSPIISAQGTDTNINLFLLQKGTGTVYIGGNGTIGSLQVSTPASMVNSFGVFGNTTGNAVSLTAIGSDTNIAMGISGKGTGAIQLYSGSNESFRFANTGNSDFTNYYTTTGQLNYTAAGGSTNINFYYQTKGTGSFNFTTGGGQQVGITNTASAVNYLQLTGAATGAAPVISAQGSDANISLVLTGKGTGVVALGGSTAANSGLQIIPTTSSVNYIEAKGAVTGQAVYLTAKGTDANIPFIIQSKGTQPFYFVVNNAIQFGAFNTASAVNYPYATGGSTGNPAVLAAIGSDTNVNLKLVPQGTGTVQFGTYTAGVVAQAGFITITDAGGTSRRLLVG